MKRIVLWHWGRRGGGPRFTLELGRALRRRGNIQPILSIPRQSDVFDAATAEDLLGYAPDTYSGTVSALGSLLRAKAITRDFWRSLETPRIHAIVSTMSSLWSPSLMNVVERGHFPFIPVIHDAATHAGERHPMRYRLQARELRCSQAAVTLTHSVARDVTRIYGYPAQKIAVIPHGIFKFDDHVITARKRPETRAFRFLFFGRLLPYKGLDLLSEALGQLAASVPIEVQIVGDGPASPVLSRLAEHPLVKLERRWFAESEIGPLLRDADALLAPYREASQSGVVSAAFAAGLPVIATPVGGLPEQIGKAGLLAADVSPRSFARAMTRLAEDGELYERLSEAAVKLALGPLSWESVAAEFETVIRRVTG